MDIKVETTPDCGLAALRDAQAWYEAHIVGTPRSPEWKHGARAGCWKAHGLAPQPSRWASGTAQDDARNAGFQSGYEHAKYDRTRGAHA